MNHFFFLIYLLAALSGIGAIARFVTLYALYKTPLLKKYLLFLFSYSAMIVSSVFAVYYGTNVQAGQLANTLFVAGVTFSAHALSFTMPEFVVFSMERQMSRFWRIFFLSLLAAGPLNTIAAVLSGGTPYAGWPPGIALFFFGVSFLYCMVVHARSGVKIVDRRGKCFLWLARGYGAVSVLSAIAESTFLAEISHAQGFSLTMPIVYLLWNAISLSLDLSPRHGGSGLHISETFVSEYHVTPQELRIVEQIVAAKSNKEIASELNISPHTVKNHLTNIFQKTGVQSRVELIRKASA